MEKKKRRGNRREEEEEEEEEEVHDVLDVSSDDHGLLARIGARLVDEAEHGLLELPERVELADHT